MLEAITITVRLIELFERNAISIAAMLNTMREIPIS